jgi:type II secretory pathway pseudopilin PulG
LMVVVAIVGVLSAVALPKFLGMTEKAELRSEIGEHTGLAKECSTAIKIEGPYPKNYPTEISATACNGGDSATKPDEDILFVSDPATSSTPNTRCGPEVVLAVPVLADDEADPPVAAADGESCQITVDADTGDIFYQAV